MWVSLRWFVQCCETLPSSFSVGGWYYKKAKCNQNVYTSDTAATFWSADWEPAFDYPNIMCQGFPQQQHSPRGYSRARALRDPTFSACRYFRQMDCVISISVRLSAGNTSCIICMCWLYGSGPTEEISLDRTSASHAKILGVMPRKWKYYVAVLKGRQQMLPVVLVNWW